MPSHRQSLAPGQRRPPGVEDKPATDGEQLEEQTGLETPVGSLAVGTCGAAAQPSATSLDRRRLQRAQRQLMAKQIGGLVGNRSLQRAILPIMSDEDEDRPPPARDRPAPHTLGPAEMTAETLPDGQIRQITQLPFTQVISRTETDGPENEGEQAQQEEPVFISEITSTQEVEASGLDSPIRATLSHVPTVAQGGAGPRGYGVTRSSLRFTNVHISPSLGTLFGRGTYTVTGNLRHEITWQVRAGRGPNSEVDIQSETDPDIKACNYQLVAKDLIPDMGDLNGRPPRSHYWACDLTIRHEQLHGEQRRESLGPDSMQAMQNWLNAQTATSSAQIQNTLLPQAMNEGITVFNTLAQAPSIEEEAYGDGAPLYLARANAIRAKGDAGDYGQVSAQVTVHPKGGGPYEVVPGDTLWGIAERTYGQGRYWRDIYDANPGKTQEGGNLIFPGTILDLPPINVGQELTLLLTSDAQMVMTESVAVPGASSHEFLVAANELFSDTTNCGGHVTVDVIDPGGHTLLSATWVIPGQAVTDDGKYRLTTRIVP